MTTPDPRHITAVQRLLRASQGPFVAKPRLPVIDEVVATVLSQQITHGRTVCKAQQPRCDACVLRKQCACGHDVLRTASVAPAPRSGRRPGQLPAGQAPPG